MISQTYAVHEQIRSFLEALHRMSEGQGLGAAGFNHGGPVVTRSYLLKLAPTKDVEKVRKDVRELIIALAARYGMPTVYHERGLYAASGGLVSYGPNYRDEFRRAARGSTCGLRSQHRYEPCREQRAEDVRVAVGMPCGAGPRARRLERRVVPQDAAVLP